MTRIVRCNMCMKSFNESEISLNPVSGDEICPYCHMSGMLMDLFYSDVKDGVKVCDVFNASYSDGMRIVATLGRIYELLNEKESYVKLTVSPITIIEKVGYCYIVSVVINGFGGMIGDVHTSYLDAVRAKEEISMMDYYKLLEIRFGLKGESTK